MRPRPATRAALLCGCLARALTAECSEPPLGTAFPRNARLPALFKSTICGPEPTSFRLAVVARADGSVLSAKRTSEEAAMPRHPRRANDASSGSPPAVHPREPLETPALKQSLATFKTSHICTCGTLLFVQRRGNRKSMVGCAQTVDDGTSLWKAQEKRRRILGRVAKVALMDVDVGSN
jgi:hypothetical protein